MTYDPTQAIRVIFDEICPREGGLPVWRVQKLELGGDAFGQALHLPSGTLCEVALPDIKSARYRASSSSRVVAVYLLGVLGGYWQGRGE
jgi:hypothetical protein